VTVTGLANTNLCGTLKEFDGFTAVTMKNAVFWNVTPCGSCKNRCFGRTDCLHHQGGTSQRAKNVGSYLVSVSSQCALVDSYC
jgi:hypothetical protein